jgi:hypothetical protein
MTYILFDNAHGYEIMKVTDGEAVTTAAVSKRSNFESAAKPYAEALLLILNSEISMEQLRALLDTTKTTQ